MTVLEVITAAAGHLEKNGVESPRLNAEHLLAHALGRRKRLDLYLEFDRPLSEAERAPLRDLVRRRAAGVPLQHLLGSVEFCGRTFLCDARALIPRPETEQLVEHVLAWEPGFRPASVLDVGTGSGVIAISLAAALPACRVAAIDVSTDALDLARANAAAHGVDGRIDFHHGDLLPEGNATFACLVANLPYIAAGEIGALSREVRHDPVLALDGGPDGMDLIARLVRTAPPRLAPGGRIALEIGHDQSARVSALLAENKYRDIVIRPDYQGIPRFVFATYG